MLVEKKTHFMQAESDYRHRIDQLEAELQKTAAEAKQLIEAESKQKLRNKILTDELSRVQGESKRSGFMVKFLLSVLLLLCVAVGVAYYFGVDLNSQATVLMEEAAPQINELIDSIKKSD